jgi:competence ComEA-like helix-hairpin-helix protein
MKSSRIQQGILAIEVVAIVAGGGVLAFIPAKPSRAPRISSETVTHNAAPIQSAGVDMLSAEERAALEVALKIDLNTATADEIALIPRIGPSAAEAIVAYREANGPFTSFAQLDAIPRIGPSLLEVIPKYARLSGVDPSALAAEPRTGGLIDINTATAEQLQEIPGAGPSMAEKIIASRPFRSVDDLKKVPGIGDATFEKFKPYVRVAGANAAPASAPGPAISSTTATSGLLNLNTASAQQLDALPDIGPSMAEAIVKYRESIGGRFSSVDQLDNVSRVGPALLAKIRPLVTVQ